ncbi:hypothetical protein DWV00_21095 [Trinickia dinghuensis]|uniref:Uncharacterized protein n=1 Tax=Trinickia dinghuensis TaxID=2291023 RepID=A0A3D8JWY0_9BURK|nr:hypothetical protein DWV00_21095 [Trinickia dinghuensis]
MRGGFTTSNSDDESSPGLLLRCPVSALKRILAFRFAPPPAMNRRSNCRNGFAPMAQLSR